MPNTLRFLSLIILSALLLISCGKSDNEDDPGAGGRTPQNDDREGQVDVKNPIRYSAIVLEENCGFWTDCDFIIRADFNRRPLIVRASFVDNGWPTDQPAPSGETDSIDEGNCKFQFKLSDEEADKLESLADELRFCEVRNNPTADGGFKGLFASDTSGKESMVYKYKNRGQEEEGKISYICAGRSGYYNYMKALIVPKAPPECPNGFKRLFR